VKSLGVNTAFLLVQVFVLVQDSAMVSHKLTLMLHALKLLIRLVQSKTGTINVLKRLDSQIDVVLFFLYVCDVVDLHLP
jgi:hypothetical protein